MDDPLLLKTVLILGGFIFLVPVLVILVSRRKTGASPEDPIEVHPGGGSGAD